MGGCVLIMAGGTGGHVFPALAVAAELQRRGETVIWMGTRAGLEASLVPKAGIAMEWIAVTGLRGKGWTSWLMAPVRVVTAVISALRIILRRRPKVVLGMGGFVSGPGAVASWMLRVPLVIHEQNAIAGVTNRMSSRLARRVLQAFPNTFGARTDVVTLGNPVRSEIVALPPPTQRWESREGPLRVLVIGGSLGAQVLNAAVPAALQLIESKARPEVRHQTGSRHLNETRAAYTQCQVTGKVEPFIDDMAAAYGWADLIICRAGALTVAEICAAGLPVIFVPYLYAVDDHQTANAHFLVRAGAARLLPQVQLTPQALLGLLSELGCTPHDAQDQWRTARARLLTMAQTARELALPDATRHVAEACMEVARV